MRDLTRAEIEEYLRFAKADTRAGDFHQGQAQLVGEVITECGLFETVGQKLRVGFAAGLSCEALCLSLWVSAFQMGRECESSLITLALKGAAPAAKAAGRAQ